jgi:hypothetical protein
VGQLRTCWDPVWDVGIIWPLIRYDFLQRSTTFLV